MWYVYSEGMCKDVKKVSFWKDKVRDFCGQMIHHGAIGSNLEKSSDEFASLDSFLFHYCAGCTVSPNRG